MPLRHTLQGNLELTLYSIRTIENYTPWYVFLVYL